jgi:hypothetical protein
MILINNHSIRFTFIKQMQISFKKIFLLALFWVNGFLLFSQSKPDTIAISNYIVKHGKIHSFFEPYLGYVNPVQYIKILTDTILFLGGIVKSFFKMDESDFVMIESNEAWFTYGNIDISGLRKSEKVNNGKFLGVVSKYSKNENEIIFAICFKEKQRTNCLNYIDLYEYLKKYRK